MARGRAGCGEAAEALYEWRQRERSRYLIAGSTLQRSSIQTHNYSIKSYYQTEREMEREREREQERESDREWAHSEEHYTEQRSAFTRAVITAAHSVHLTSPLDSLSSRSLSFT